MERFEDKKQDMADDITFSLEGVAEMLKVSTAKIEDWINTGELPCLPTGPSGELRFGMNEVVDLLLKEKKRELGIK
jgi:predicted site-specific integrase-resolvase